MEKAIDERMLQNVLYAFLKKEGVLNEFVTEYCQYHGWNIDWLSSEPIPKYVIKDVIEKNAHDLYVGALIKQMFSGSYRRTFPWDASKKGIAFWNEISVKWVKYTDGLIKAKNIR